MSATNKVHGMDGTLVAPDWPPLALDELRPLLIQFPSLGASLEIVSASPRHHAVRDAEGLQEEHRFLAHLFHAGAPVPRVYASTSGKTAIQIGEWTYEIHATPAGIDLYGDAISWTPFRSAAHAYSAGKAMARLHRAAEDYVAPRRKIQPLVASFTIFAAHDPALELERYLTARPALASEPAVEANSRKALDLLTPFHARLQPLLPSLPSLWTHNDLHSSNLFWSDTSDDAQATAIIDFGLADRTNAVHDLANAIERNIVEWLVLVNNPAHPDDVPVHFDHLTALLEGYESVRPLTAEEAAALVPMTALCHAEFALSEADYFLGVLHSREKAQMAHDGWLVGHAHWFESAAGRKLLDAIAAWAANRNSLLQKVVATGARD